MSGVASGQDFHYPRIAKPKPRLKPCTVEGTEDCSLLSIQSNTFWGCVRMNDIHSSSHIPKSHYELLRVDRWQNDSLINLQ